MVKTQAENSLNARFFMRFSGFGAVAESSTHPLFQRVNPKRDVTILYAGAGVRFGGRCDLSEGRREWGRLREEVYRIGSRRFAVVREEERGRAGLNGKGFWGLLRRLKI